MKSQAEIRAIQAKLQAIQAGRSYSRQPSPADSPSEPCPTGSSTASAPQLLGKTSVLISPESLQQLASTVESLQQRSTPYVQQFRQLQPYPLTPVNSTSEAKPTARQQLSTAFQRLEVQVEHINDLAVAQETAMRELKAIADRLERDWKAIELEEAPGTNLEAMVPVVCDYLTTTVPYVEKDDNGTFLLTTRAIDLFKAEREAALTAQTLRSRSGKTDYSTERKSERAGSSVSRPTKRDQLLPPHGSADVLPVERWKLLWQQCLTFLGIMNSAPPRRKRRSLTRRAAHDQAPSFGAQDAVAWFIGAVLARLALNWIIASHPAFWLPAVAVVIAPAAIAIYRTSASPQTSLVWGYRLLLIMLGLLVGGRLG